jgi:stage V sporulation protein AB
VIGEYAVLALLGFAWGAAVGSGFIALLAALDVIPRLVQLSRSRDCIRLYEWALILGGLSATIVDLFSVSMELPIWTMAVFGLLSGVFVGMLSAALTEVLNVLPILARRFRMQSVIPYLVSAMVIGKIIGSLINFLFPALSP